MLVIGLTGGIGSGKSTVADFFAQLGVPVIDTDLIARELVQPGMPALEIIRQYFPDEVIMASGELDRHKLRSIIFQDKQARKTLESILHPLIRDEVRHRTSQLDDDYCIVVIPLLVETSQQDVVDKILVVDADETIQRHRAAQRDNSSEQDIQKIMDNQVTRQQRLAAADYILENKGDMNSLQKKVSELHHIFQLLAQQHV